VRPIVKPNQPKRKTSKDDKLNKNQKAIPKGMAFWFLYPIDLMLSENQCCAFGNKWIIFIPLLII
jgi:hypothetical protein